MSGAQDKVDQVTRRVLQNRESKSIVLGMAKWRKAHSIIDVVRQRVDRILIARFILVL